MSLPILLVTDRLALEGMRTVDTVLFDKTGTLTRGEPELSHIESAPGSGLDAATVLGLAAAAESESEHPLAGAIRRRAAADGVRILYGGSVTGDNARAIMAVPDVDGALVGGAGLTAAKFVPIIEAAVG